MSESGIASVLPYAKDPLVLIGIVLFLLFSFFRAVVRAGVVPQLSKASGYRYLRLISTYGFLLALTVIAAGIWLKHGEMSDAEQRRAVTLLRTELGSNRNVISGLAANAASLLGACQSIATAVRGSGSPALAALFPPENIPVSTAAPVASQKVADLALSRFAEGGYLDSKKQLQEMTARAREVAAVIERTEPTIRSLSDPEGKRYVLSRSIWEANEPVLRRISVFPIERLLELHSRGEKIRSDYDVVVGHAVEYVDAMHNVLTGSLDRPKLAGALAAEQLAFRTMTTYATSLEAGIREYQQVEADLSAGTM